MAHVHNIYDTDNHFIIDPISRTIRQQSGKTKLMQHDHNSERYTFELSRYIEGHDMSLCDNIKVHYINVGTNKAYQSEGPYKVVDMQVDPDSDDVIIFSWLLSGKTTTYAGTLSFAISFACLDETVIDYAWHTDTFSGITVSGGLHNEGEDVIVEYNDILTEWENRLFGAEGNAIKAIEKARDAALQSIEDKMNPGDGANGIDYFEMGETLTMTDNVLNVKTTDVVSANNNLPITSAAVYTILGDIEAALAAL